MPNIIAIQLPSDRIKKNQSRRKWWFEPVKASE
jgi:hypothetical protein